MKLDSPASLSITGLTYLCCKQGPKNGIFFKNATITGKKLPNKFAIPNNSIAIPTTGHFIITRIYAYWKKEYGV